MKVLYKPIFRFWLIVWTAWWVSASATYAQNVVKVEYYLDTEPGFGKGINVPIDPDTEFTKTFNLDVNGIPAGFHKVYIRALVQPYQVTEDDKIVTKGGWSLTSIRSFYKENFATGNSLANVVKGEYFIDSDPGFGQGTNILIRPGQDLKEVLFPVNLTGLPAGFHNLYVRFKDSNKNWGLTSVRSFYKENFDTGNSLAKIVKGEYFFDTDPGFGQGINIALNPGADPSGISLNADVSKLGLGFHQLYIRFKDAHGNWGHTNVRSFYKEVLTTADPLPNLVQAEYFIDTDPGFGKGKKITVDASVNIPELTFPVDVAGLTVGKHQLYVRAKDAKGDWSLTNTAAFEVKAQAEAFITVGNINGNTCGGSPFLVPFAVNIPFAPDNVFTAQLSNGSGNFDNPINIGSVIGNSSAIINAIIPANIAAGTGYKIRILASAPADTSAASSSALTIGKLEAQAFSIIGKINTCIGTEAYSIDKALPGNIKYSWHLSGGGTIDTTGANARINWTTPGTHTIKLIISNACGSSPERTLQVTVFGTPPTLMPTVTSNGRNLQAATASSTNGISGYQWYKDGVAISGGTNSSYSAVEFGSYTVRYTNPCGAGPASNAIVFATDNGEAQIITFRPVADKNYGDAPITLNASTSSSLPVTYRIISGPATIAANILTLTGAGTIIVEATQAGNGTYKPADPVRQSFRVNKASQTVSFEIVPENTHYRLIASSSAGLPVSFSVTSGAGAIAGNILTLTGAGEITVRAAQAGNQNYTSAFAEGILCVAAGPPSAISGYPETCRSSQRYSVAAVPGVSYTWSVSGGGTLVSRTGAAVTVNWTELGTHTLTVTAATKCDTSDVALSSTLAVQVTNSLIPGAVTNLYPANGTIVNAFPFPVSWQPGANTQSYDLYIWADGTAEPTTPAVTNINQIGYAIRQNDIPDFAAGKKYNWKVVARNACTQTGSVAQNFIVSDLPNLVVQKVNVPTSAFSGQLIDITAVIENTGKADTKNTQWFDAVYLSTDNVLNKAVDIYLGGMPSVSALRIGQSYTNTFKVRLPENQIGNAHIIIETNAYRALAETSTADNAHAQAFEIKLTPPPDLEVASVITTGDAFSGQEVHVQWTVNNKGQGNTLVSLWKDIIYISPDPEFDASRAIKIGERIYKQGILNAGSNYAAQMTVTLPEEVFGTHYINVVTDANKQVFEFSFENNNSKRSDAINIILSPTPDLIVSKLDAPDTVTSEELITIDWAVQNQGAVPVKEKYRVWYDAIYISKEPAFNMATAKQLKAITPKASNANKYPEMKRDEQYTTSATIAVPAKIEGAWYIHLVTDYTKKVFEFGGEDNNTATKRIEVVNPDLVVAAVEAPETASSGNDISIEWTVRNDGEGKVLAKSREDVIWLSTNPVFSPATANQVDALQYNSALDAKASTLKQKSVKLANDLFGTYYFFVETDRRNQIYESGKEDNNRNVSKPVQVTLSPWPDLVVQEVTLSSATITSEKKFEISYKAANTGSGELIGKSWIDRIYISKEPTWDISKAHKLKDIERTQALAPNASYEVRDSLTLSMRLLRDIGVDMMDCYFYVLTDATNAVYEHTAENNNTNSSKPIHILHAPHADFEVLTVIGSDSAYAGRLANIAWSVKNLGGRTGYYYDYWYDGVFMSRDTIWDDKDIFVTDKTVYGPLETNGIYRNHLNFTVPNGLSGTYYLLLVADHTNLNRDRNRANNYKVITITVTGPDGQPIPGADPKPQPIYVTLTPSADLTINAFQLPAIGVGGQPVTAKWKIVNQGAGATAKGKWVERFYLSTNDKIDSGDPIIGTYTRTGDLSAGASYEDSLQLFLPISARGNYYVLMATDANDGIYEHNAEANNLAAALVFVTQAIPSDLIVSEVTVPAQAMSGDTITVQYTVKNIGMYPASGYITNGLYVSADSLWDKEDILLASPRSSIKLPPLGEVTYTQQVELKGVTPGNLYGLVFTDLGNNIFEDNEENNFAVSGQRIQVSVPELPINVVTAASLKNQDELYYRLEIPDDLHNGTLLVSLKGDSVAGANELYIKYGSMPSRTAHDFAFGSAISANQEIIIPTLNKGTYYLMVYGATSKNTHQAITLLAKPINFGIHSIAAKEGGNTGAVTVKITGAKFVANMQVSLARPGAATLVAQSVKLINSTSLFASFNLAGADLGAYNVILRKTNNEEAALAAGFTVIAGSGGGIAGGSSGNSGGASGFYCSIKNIGVDNLTAIHIDHPDAVRVNRIFPIIVHYGNSGNVDIPVPVRFLSSLSNAAISFDAEGLTKVVSTHYEGALMELLMEFKEPGGPDGVLRPGATGSITFYAHAVNNRAGLTFRLIGGD